ncbi:adhesion G-protein coupled receptor G2 [Danio aesculapii]|uniref:adhesion G-protein coupled receptor G2 n=1 Tax=Danio aesculapii TaxID=1142201 RepID=UPI0024C07E04|nr:adhesion G-protein coupled receptor G2 [Danio aesculapii]
MRRTGPRRKRLQLMDTSEDESEVTSWLKLLEIPEMMSTTAARHQRIHFCPEAEPKGKMVTGDVSKLASNRVPGDLLCSATCILQTAALHPEMCYRETENHSDWEEMLYAKSCTIVVCCLEHQVHTSFWKESAPLQQILLMNLEIQLRMKWKTISLLLILSALFSEEIVCADNDEILNSLLKFANQIKKNPDKQKNNDIDMFLLGKDGFMGYMTAGICNEKGHWKHSLGSDLGGCVQSSGNNFNILIFPFDKNGNCTENTLCSTNRSDLGVSFTRVSPYKLAINRLVLPTFVCLIKGHCRNSSWINWITNDCDWTKNDTNYFKTNDTKCNMTCLNPTTTCNYAVYDSSCSGVNASGENNVNNYVIDEMGAACSKCGSPLRVLTEVQNPELAAMFEPKNDSAPEISAATAAVAMKSLSKILSSMENMTIASVSMGSVKGVLKKIQSESEVTDTAFIYSPETGVSVIDDISVLKKFPNALIVPKEAAQQALNQSARGAFLGVFRFPNMSKDANNSVVLNNEVYAIEMGTQIKNLSNTINLSFNMSQSMPGTPTCYSWDGNGSKPDWTTEGCRTVVNGSGITCKCEHLTFFAVLMKSFQEAVYHNRGKKDNRNFRFMPTNESAPPDITLRESDLTALTYITYIGCGLSMFFLGVGLFMHFLMRKAKATSSVHVLINLFVALFMLNVAFLTNEYVVQAKNSILCRVMAAFLHYCLLASFTWFAVEALHLCLQMTKTTTLKHYLLKITVAGWAPPAFVVSVIFSLGKYGEENIKTESSNVTMCWIVDSTVHYVVNIGYYCFVFTFTLGTFIVVVRWLSMLRMSKWSKDGKVKRSNTATSDIFTMLGLCCLLGLTWGISFFSYGALRIPSYYIFTILNSLQGFFLFVYYLKTSTFFGDSAPSEKSEKTEVTDNPYEDAT